MSESGPVAVCGPLAGRPGAPWVGLSQVAVRRAVARRTRELLTVTVTVWRKTLWLEGTGISNLYAK